MIFILYLSFVKLQQITSSIQLRQDTTPFIVCFLITSKPGEPSDKHLTKEEKGMDTHFTSGWSGEIKETIVLNLLSCVIRKQADGQFPK